MLTAKITVNPLFIIGEIDPRLYSGFIEHIGRAVYGGIYDPESPEADESGFRQDVIELVRELDMPLTRYPGGNFVSGYNWEDGIGPRAERPARLDLAWKALEPNAIGTDEFIEWCRKANTVPMLAVNLGTRGATEAQALVEYCNFPGGTYWSDKRRQNGAEKPYNVRTWCLGNEMDGPWQTGHKNASEYGKVAREAAKMMKGTDPNIELVVCGSSSPGMDSFGEWEETVLNHTCDLVDFLALHIYFSNSKQLPLADFCASSDLLGRYIENAVAMTDAVCARKRQQRKIMISVDEWNVWYHSHGSKNQDPEWTVGRCQLEDIYDMADILVNGSALIEFLNHADRVKMACLAQTVNVIAPIMVEKDGKAWKQTIYYPQYYTSRYGRGISLQQIAEIPTQAVSNPAPGMPCTSPVIKSAVVCNSEETVIFAVNRSPSESVSLQVALQNLSLSSIIEQIEIAHPDLTATNSPQVQNVTPRKTDQAKLTTDNLHSELAPASWNMIRLR